MPVPSNPWDRESGHNLHSQVLDHMLAFGPKSVSRIVQSLGP